MTNWEAYAENRKTRQPTLELSIQRFLLSHLRFILAVALCQEWVPFVGLAPQLSLLSIAINLSAVEIVGVALQYRQSSKTKLAEIARRRANYAASFTLLMSTEKFDLREQARREVAFSANVKEKTPHRPRPPNSLILSKKNRARAKLPDRTSLAALVLATVRERHNE